MSETQKLNLDNFEYCDESGCDDSEYEDEEQSECETECEDGSYLPSEIANFKVENDKICNNNAKSLQNLLRMYDYIYNKNAIDIFLNETSYFDKIIFLKFLLFFKTLEDINDESLRNNLKNSMINLKKRLLFIGNHSLFNPDNYYPDNNLRQINQEIYDIVLKNIKEDSESLNEYNKLFNPLSDVVSDYNTRSQATSQIFVDYHGGLLINNDVKIGNKHYLNKYVTIQSNYNININIYRWGERGKCTHYFDSMKYTWKQILLEFIEKLNVKLSSCDVDNLIKSTLNTDLRERFNFNTYSTNKISKSSDTNPFPLTQYNPNKTIRVKTWSTDDKFAHVFSNPFGETPAPYTLPPDLVTSLINQINKQNNTHGQDILPNLKLIQFNTADSIIELNKILFENNIGYSVFFGNRLNPSNYSNRTNPSHASNFNSTDGINLNFTDEKVSNPPLASFKDFHFPLDIFPTLNGAKFFIEDFTLEADIYFLNDINIRIPLRDDNNGISETNIKIKKGDSFVSNPYIIQYFIQKFQSTIAIRPITILNNRNDIHFQNNIRPDTNKGQTITCPSRGLTCYKVVLASLNVAEMLKFCDDVKINIDIFDTSCQSFSYINSYGKGTKPRKKCSNTLKRMHSSEEEFAVKDFNYNFNNTDNKIKYTKVSHKGGKQTHKYKKTKNKKTKNRKIKNKKNNKKTKNKK